MVHGLNNSIINIEAFNALYIITQSFTHPRLAYTCIPGPCTTWYIRIFLPFVDCFNHTSRNRRSSSCWNCHIFTGLRFEKTSRWQFSSKNGRDLRVRPFHCKFIQGNLRLFLCFIEVQPSLYAPLMTSSHVLLMLNAWPWRNLTMEPNYFSLVWSEMLNAEIQCFVQVNFVNWLIKNIRVSTIQLCAFGQEILCFVHPYNATLVYICTVSCLWIYELLYAYSLKERP